MSSELSPELHAEPEQDEPAGISHGELSPEEVMEEAPQEVRVAGADAGPATADEKTAAEEKDAVDEPAKVGVPDVLPVNAESAEAETIQSVAGEPEPVPAADAKEQVEEETSAANLPLLTLKPAFVSRDLVTLRPDVAGMVASYERVAGRVLGRPWRRSSLFFTSPQADGGSTATAVNVATMVSRSAESALLVELQLTEASLWSLFGRPPVKHGLEEALRGQVSFEDCVFRIAGEKLDVLMVKEAMTVEETEHLSGALNDFLEWAEERFAWLIADCPPVLAETWTRWFDLNADPVVLVAGSDKTKKYELRRVAHRLGDRLSGTILNESSRAQRVG